MKKASLQVSPSAITKRTERNRATAFGIGTIAGVVATKDGSRKIARREVLSGWKEIADFFGKGVRTVQRYERELGLPVRRPAAKARGSVVAVRAELDGWVRASPIRETFQLRNTPLHDRLPTDALRKGVSELVQLRGQMLTLRFELKKSLQRLQDSVYLLQGELRQGGANAPSTLFSRDERDSLSQSHSHLITAPVKSPKAN